MSIDDQVLHARLLALETRVGLAPKADESTSSKDITSRLALLEDKWKSSTTTTFNSLCDESDKILEELQPGAGLTYQQALLGRSKDYPILYRQQLVLASHESLHRDMAQLSTILNILSIGQKTVAASNTAAMVMQAPILNTPPITPDQERRLDILRVSAVESQRQTVDLANRMDSIIAIYQTAMLTLSDRMIRLEEKSTKQK